MARSVVKVNLRPLRRVIAALGRQPVNRQLANQWAAIYSAYVRDRFKKLSRGGSAGGGSWKPLKPTTIARRRKGKGKGKPAILRDTGALFNGLTVGNAANLVKSIRNGIRFGYRKVRKHDKGPTIDVIADAHDRGKGNAPERSILVEPDRKTIVKLTRATMLRIEKLGRRIGGRT